MNSSRKLARVVGILVAILPFIAFGDIPSGSDGSDGDLVITKDTTIDLGKASTGAWDADNTGNSSNGVYDNDKWAVVFKFNSVSIAAGATVRFLNHPSRAPVVWLVKGNALINGTILLDGQNGSFDGHPFGTEGGPGGFRGMNTDRGLGPGGGANGTYSESYGNPQIQPLIGGSGSGAGFAWDGGAGGGAILIVAGGRISVLGTISALGGRSNGATASGGAIRLVANELTGTGKLLATPGGRIRLEANLQSASIVRSPDVTDIVRVGNTPQIWPGADAPVARIVKVGGVNAPADPRARIDSGADLGIQAKAAVDVMIETRNFPTTGEVLLRVGPKLKAALPEQKAEFVSGDKNLALWRVSTTIPPEFSVLQARAVVRIP